MSTTATHHSTTITDVYAAFARGDIPAILDALAEDVRWEHWDDNTAQRRGVSHLQARTGRDGAAEFFAAIGELDFHTFEIRGLAAGDDLVVADILIDVTLPSGGRMRDEELHAWRFRRRRPHLRHAPLRRHRQAHRRRARRGHDRPRPAWAHRRSGAGTHDPRPVDEHDDLHAIAEVQLLEDARNVRLGRALAHDELRGDLGVGEAERDEPEHLEILGAVPHGHVRACGTGVLERVGERLLHDPVTGGRRKRQRITVGANGALWFTEQAVDQIGRLRLTSPDR